MPRLADLDPRWVGIVGFRLGFSFLCPDCREQRIVVYFRPCIQLGTNGLYLNDITNNEAEINPQDRHIWQRQSGDTFDDLTLTPSVDASGHGHWHGNITNGGIA